MTKHIVPASPDAGKAVADAENMAFCGTCVFSATVRQHDVDRARLRELEVLVEHSPAYRAGEHIFREGEPFTTIAAVRVGTVKSYVVSPAGREQVLGFHLPGEVIGLNAISRERYPCNAVALDTVLLCRFSFPEISRLATRLPGLQHSLFRLLSEDIGKAGLLAGDFTAGERLATFLVLLSRRYAARGQSASRFRLTMSRTDIASYLHLAAETVSRVLRGLQDDGLLQVHGREVEILDPLRLATLANGVLRES